MQHLPDSAYIFFYWQVTQVSPKLKKLKGHVMKLGLKRFHQHNGNNHGSCLLFKAKGEIHCKYETNIFNQIMSKSICKCEMLA